MAGRAKLPQRRLCRLWLSAMTKTMAHSAIPLAVLGDPVRIANERPRASRPVGRAAPRRTGAQHRQGCRSRKGKALSRPSRKNSRCSTQRVTVFVGAWLLWLTTSLNKTSKLRRGYLHYVSAELSDE